MECLICKADVAKGSHYCSACGTPLLRTCPACAHRYAASSKFCSECGATLTPSASGPLPARQRPPLLAPTAGVAEHRQLSVMFCDLVGSVTLAERLDAEDLR